LEIFGNDHYITNTIVFSSLIGVTITGAANLLTGVHTWNMASVDGGVGFYVNTPGYSQNRFIACYLDYNSLIVVDPEHVTIEGGFFLCGGNIVIQASTQNHEIQGLSIRDNQYDGCNNDSIIVDERAAKFTGIYDTVIDGNMMSPTYRVKSSKETAQLRQVNAQTWTFDFTNRLLFSKIETVDYSIQIEGNVFARHTARPPVGRTVTIETDVPVTATVTVTVDQSVQSHPCSNGKCRK